MLFFDVIGQIFFDFVHSRFDPFGMGQFTYFFNSYGIFLDLVHEITLFEGALDT